ncbi:unnamed protein product, partial [Tilletia laevis]
MGRVIRAQ